VECHRAQTFSAHSPHAGARNANQQATVIINAV